MKGVVQQKGTLYLVCPKIMLPPINRDTPQNMPVLNGDISAGYLYFSLKSEEIGISRLPHTQTDFNYKITFYHCDLHNLRQYTVYFTVSNLSISPRI